MAKNWIAGAIKTRGGLHQATGIPAGQKISSKKLSEASAGRFGPKAVKEASLAKTLAGFSKK